MLSPVPRMECGRRLEGNGPWGLGSTAGNPNRWWSGKVMVSESGSPDALWRLLSESVIFPVEWMLTIPASERMKQMHIREGV